MNPNMSIQPMFGRHETFTPRFGWFKKTFDGIAADPRVFAGEEATLSLGVGKNMVRSMRFWAGAAALVTPRRPTRGEELRPTHLAETVFADDGWDPYLESPSTLWLLHWQMLSPGCQLPVWHFAFNDFSQTEFSVDTLSAESTKAIPLLYGFQKAAAPASIRRDVECLIHTYARKIDGRVLLDDSMACPFTILGLVEMTIGRPGHYRFKFGPKPSLHDDIVLAACLEFAGRENSASRSVGLGRLLRNPMAPGRVFKLDEDSLLEALSRATRDRRDLRVVDSAGVTALQFSSEPDEMAVEILNCHFRRSRSARKLFFLREREDLLALRRSTHNG